MTSINNLPSNKIDSKMLDSLFDLGIEVLGTKENFTAWLEMRNFFFDKKAPSEFMNTAEGIKFIHDRLTGIAYGDNA
jgi:uncharacterized protein (DUF2384 family)